MIALPLKAIGVELDLSDKGLGVRSRRYAMYVDDGAVSFLLSADRRSALHLVSCGSGISWQ